MHLHDEAHGLMGGTPIVGSAVSLATGSAWAAKLEGSHRLTVVFCGDAVPETGQFWESLNFASLHNLRLLYVIEDNGLSTATPQDVRRGKLWQQFCYAVGEGMDAITVEHELDDFASVYGGALGALQSLARQRPAILEVDTTRACAHVGPEIDHDQLLNRDHLLTLRRAAGEKADGISRVVDAQVDAAFRAAEDAPWPA
jgi:pyruvate dehydrogenase E1 component alpha subunit